MSPRDKMLKSHSGSPFEFEFVHSEMGILVSLGILVLKSKKFDESK